MLLEQAVHVLVKFLHHLEAAVFPEGTGEDFAEGLLLLRGAHACIRLKDPFDERLVLLRGIAGIEEGAVQIRCAAVEGGEEESQGGILHELADGQAVKGLIFSVIAEPGLSGPHRADRRKKIPVHGLGGIGKRLVIPGAAGNIVGVRGQEDQEVAAVRLQRFDHAAEVFRSEPLVLQIRPEERDQESVGFPLRDGGGREGELPQVLAPRAGQRLFEEIEIDLGFFAGQKAGGHDGAGYDLFRTVDVTAVYFPDGAPAGSDMAADLADLFGVHKRFLSERSPPQARQTALFYHRQRQSANRIYPLDKESAAWYTNPTYQIGRNIYRKTAHIGAVPRDRDPSKDKEENPDDLS